MEKFIEVYDNILPPQIADAIEQLVLDFPAVPLYYTSHVGGKDHEFSPAFSSNFYFPQNNQYSIHCHLLLEVLYRLGHFKNILIQDIIHARAFVHLPSPTPGPDGKHVDLEFPHWVCLYYINDSEGDTILFDDDDNEIKRVSPKKGRIVFFDGSIKHCSSRPSSKTRAILNFDFLGKSLNDN